MDTQGMENLINLYIKERDLATLGKCYQHLYHRAGSCSVGGLIQLHQSRNAARFESYRFITNGKESIALPCIANFIADYVKFLSSHMFFTKKEMLRNCR